VGITILLCMALATLFVYPGVMLLLDHQDWLLKLLGVGVAVIGAILILIILNESVG